MEKSIQTRLELLKSGVKPELILDEKEAPSKASRLASKAIDLPNKQELESYQVTKLLENREQIPEDAHQCHYCTDFAYFSMI